AGRIVAVLRGDRRQRDPVLQPLDRFVVPLRDFAANIAQVVGRNDVRDRQHETDDQNPRFHSVYSSSASRNLNSDRIVLLWIPMEREVVVITGASAGIGRATAQAFAKRGAKIALIARGRGGLEAAK